MEQDLLCVTPCPIAQWIMEDCDSAPSPVVRRPHKILPGFLVLDRTALWKNSYRSLWALCLQQARHLDCGRRAFDPHGACRFLIFFLDSRLCDQVGEVSIGAHYEIRIRAQDEMQ